MKRDHQTETSSDVRTPPGPEQAVANLRKYWGFENFRNGQERAVHAVLEGRDTLVLLPTGGGKSLCYQVPATLFEGLTLVISPLVSLMQDQVEQLSRAGIRATFINSTLSSFEVEQRLLNARNGMYKLLYLSPERLHSTLWLNMARDLNLSMVAVDEAHCVSQWGHDFRPHYREIRKQIDLLEQNPRWIALTATATPEVREDIIKNLELENPEVVASGFQRPNLQWWVTPTEQKRKTLLRAVAKGVQKGSGIVYAGTRLECEKISSLLNHHGVRARTYHAGLSGEERQGVQQAWLEGVFPVVVATNAFGMGIDKPDCRFVIHYDMPYTLEAYYQEAGRAGRDGNEAFPLLLYRPSDVRGLRSRLLKSYPAYKQLTSLYRVLCDELELAVGSLQVEAEPVSVASLSRRSTMDESVVRAGLKVLERLEILELVREAEPSVGIHFTVGRDTLQERVDASGDLKSRFLDQLHRLCGPEAFQKIHYLNLDRLLEKTGMTRSELMKAIRVLSDYDRILTAHWMEGESLIRVLEPRSTRLQVSREEVEGYRNILLKKLEQMKLYAETTTCRERFLRIYFGEHSVEPCGHCDRCRSRASEEPAVSDRIDLEALQQLLSEPVSLSELAPAMGWKRERVRQVLTYLIGEDQVKASEEDPTRYIWKRPRRSGKNNS